jgi:hypothetical protein
VAEQARACPNLPKQKAGFSLRAKSKQLTFCEELDFIQKAVTLIFAQNQFYGIG